MSAEYDAVVAGGGLAGATAAESLARCGWRVLLAERKTDPGAFNYCAEAVSARAIAAFDLPADMIAAPIDGGILVGPGRIDARLLWPGVGHVLHRDRWMRRVFERAAAVGAEPALGHAVVDVERDREGRLCAVLLESERGKLRIGTRSLVCADGVAGSVARQAGIASRLAVGEILICAQYRLSGIRCELGFPEFWIGDAYAPGGYAWVFPRSEQEANVGVGMVASRPSAGGRNATQWLKRFRRERFQSAGKIESYITGGIPTVSSPQSLSAQGALCAGDAARAADPLSAAGIAEAMHSGRHAAATLHAALLADDLSAARLAGAELAYRAEFPRLRSMASIRRIYDRLDDRGKAALVLACRRAFHERRIDAMEPLGMFLQLLRAAPPLVGYARHLLFDRA